MAPVGGASASSNRGDGQTIATPGRVGGVAGMYRQSLAMNSLAAPPHESA